MILAAGITIGEIRTKHVQSTYKTRTVPVPKVYPVQRTCLGDKRTCFGVQKYVLFAYKSRIWLLPSKIDF